MWRAECEIPTCLGYSERVNLLLIWGKGWVKDKADIQLTINFKTM